MRRRGEERARALHAQIDELLTLRGAALRRYAFLLCGDVHEAEDLVQDAVVRVFSRARDGQGPQVLEPYVRRAIVNGSVDRWRRAGRWREREHLLVAPDRVDGPERASADRLDVLAALAGLPARQRACVVLRFYEDLTVPEISERLGIGKGSVKRYLSMGVRALQDRLGSVSGADAHVELIEEGAS